MPVELISQLILQRRLCSSIVVFEMGVHFRYEIRRVLAMRLVCKEPNLCSRHRDSSLSFPQSVDKDLACSCEIRRHHGDIALANKCHWENNCYD
jgi:hypothetical protein